MKTQRNIIYITMGLIIVCITAYAGCVFGWSPIENSMADNWKVFLSNIIIGILGSSIVSLFIGIMSYKNDAERVMGTYKRKQVQLFDHCSMYNKYEDKVLWFKEYRKNYIELSDAWAEIAFLFDPMKHRLYLKEILDFYGDFIVLTQNEFRLLDEEISNEGKDQIMKKIKDIIFETKIKDQGILKTTLTTNKFTRNMEVTFNNIDGIYCNRKKFLLKKYVFHKTMINRECFEKLDFEDEIYVKSINNIIGNTSSTHVTLNIPENVVNNLMKKGYISGYLKNENGEYSLDCQFILFHYFELKERMEKYYI